MTAARASQDDKWTLPYLRFWIISLGTLASSVNHSCVYAYNFASICGVESGADNEGIYQNNSRHSPIMYFSTAIDSINYSMFSVGLVIALGYLIVRPMKISTRNQILVATAILTVSTALIPPLYDIWPQSTPILKFIQGVVRAPAMPLIGVIVAHWTPINEIGFAVGVMTSFSQLGIFLAMAPAGFLCEYAGWRSIFYFNAGLAGLTTLLWAQLFRDYPEGHPLISQSELAIITEHKKDDVKREPVPYRSFFSDRSIWAILIAAVGNHNGTTPLILYAAVIFKKAIGLTDMETSFFNSTTTTLQLATKILSGVISDRWTSAGESFKTRFFNAISSGLCGVLMIALAFLPVSNKILCASVLAGTKAFVGFNSAGYYKAAMIVAKQHSHFIITIIGFIACVSSLMEPFLVWALAPESTWDQWFWLLIIHGVILIGSEVIFCSMIRTQPAHFTKKPVGPYKIAPEEPTSSL